MFFGAAMLVGTISGGLLGQIHLYLPYLVRAALVVPLFGLAWFGMPALGHTRRAFELRRAAAEMHRVLAAGTTHRLRHPGLRPPMLAALRSVSFMFFGFYRLQP